MGILNVADKAANDHYQVSNKTRVQKYLQRVFSPAAGQGQNRNQRTAAGSLNKFLEMIRNISRRLFLSKTVNLGSVNLLSVFQGVILIHI